MLEIQSCAFSFCIIKTIYEEEGPSLVVAKCQAKATPLVFPHSFDGSVSINRFMSTLKS